MPTPSPTTRLPAALRRAGLVLALIGISLWAMGACCNGECIPPEPDGGTNLGDCEGLDCAVASPGCDATGIRSAGGAVCATCDAVSGDGTSEICGVPDVARCEAREDSEGNACRFCATALGEILYDSCYSDVQPDVANCESSAGPEPGQGGDIVCETCTDARGAVVSTVCEPAHDECHDVVDGGRTCRECTRAGDVVVYACEQPDIAPRSCEAYANELGRCIDCYDDNDQLLLHSCTLAGDPFVSCSDSVTPDGLRCTVCVDANGGPVSRQCDPFVAELQQCSLLEYSEQSCVVCVDQTGGPAFSDCDRNDCQGEGCAPPPACVFGSNDLGQLCRTCPIEASGASETRCVEDTNLQCSAVDATEPNGGVTGTCISCIDAITQTEVYRRCDGSGAPPTCVPTQSATGAVCEVCSDPVTDAPVYATCDGQTCYALGQYQLTSVEGSSLFLDNSVAVARCTECGVAVDNVVALGVGATCTLRDDCGTTDLTNPAAVCDRAVAFQLRPRLCENPWELAGYDGGGQPGSFELLQILSFTLQRSGVGLISATGTAGAGGTCTNSCACDRGDTIELRLRPEDAVAVSQLFEGVIQRCQADADCGSGACRVDGSCGP